MLEKWGPGKGKITFPGPYFRFKTRIKRYATRRIPF